MEPVKNRGTRVADNTFDRIQARNGLGTKTQSQMDRIVAALQASGKPLEEEAVIATKLEARVKKLDVLQADLKKMEVKLAELPLLEASRQLKRITSQMKVLETILAAKPLPVGVSKHLKVCMNELTSLREGVYVGAAKKKALAVASVTAAVTAINELRDTSAARLSKIAAASTGNDDNLFSDDALRVIKNNEAESHKLDAIHRKPFVIARIPLVPVAKSFLTTDKLKRMGFKAESLGGYPVVHNQLVIGVNKKMLDEKKQQSGAKIRPEDWKAAADTVRKLIQKQTNRKLFLVSEKPYGAQGGAWFWLMSENELSQFASAFPGKRVQLERWGFAF